MELVRRNLVMTFGTAEGKTLNLTISRPKSTLGGVDVKNAMEAVVACDVLGEVSKVTTVGSAKYVIQQQERIDLA